MLCMAGPPLPPSTRCAVRYGVIQLTEGAMAKPRYSCDLVVRQ